MIAGLDGLNGTDRHANATTTRISLQNGKVYPLTIIVKSAENDASIEASFDGKKLFKWDGAPRELSVKNIFAIPDKKAISLQAWQSGVEFSEITLIMLSGTAERLRDEKGK